jgi:hypothetical protein
MRSGYASGRPAGRVERTVGLGTFAIVWAMIKWLRGEVGS